MQALIRYFSLGDDFQNVQTALDNGIKEQLISGLSNSSRTLFMSALHQNLERPILIITHNLHHAEKVYEDLLEWIGEQQVALYPVNELISSEVATASPELKGQRIQVLNQLVRQQVNVVVAPLAGIRRLLPPVQVWQDAQLQFFVGQEIDLENTYQKLITLGYQRVEMIEAQGEFSVRGGILDIFPASSENPIRLELFDTELESIRYFDMNTQRSIDQSEQVVIGPTSEWLLDSEHYHYAYQLSLIHI